MTESTAHTPGGMSAGSDKQYLPDKIKFFRVLRLWSFSFENLEF
jgi:hypothetical protein